jgi:aryl-alcohol dehydrogenase-like predicted oxidoreductase
MTLRPEPYAELENERTFRALEEFVAAAADRGVEPSTLAVAWVLSNPHVTAVVVGPRGPEQLETVLGAPDLRLSVQERDELARLFTQPSAGARP